MEQAHDYQHAGLRITKTADPLSLWIVNLNTGLRYGYKTRSHAESKAEQFAARGEG